MRNIVKGIGLFFAALLLSQYGKTQIISIVKPQPAHTAWANQSNIYEVNVRQYTPSGTF